MNRAFRALLVRFEDDPSLAAELINEVAAVPEWFAPFDAQGEPIAVKRGSGRFLPIAAEAEDVAGQGSPRPMAAHLVWAMVGAGQIDGVVLDLEGPSPGWVDAGGVYRINGVPGLKLRGKLVARSVVEAHLIMDLMGWPPGRRGHRLVTVDGEMVAEYCWDNAPDGEPSVLRFDVPDPGLGSDGFGGPEPSSLLDPVGWRIAGDLIARGIPTPTDGMDKAKARGFARQLRRAADCLNESLRFSRDGEIPADAFFDSRSRLVAELNPAMVDPDRLSAVAEAWSNLAEGFARRGAR